MSPRVRARMAELQLNNRRYRRDYGLRRGQSRYNQGPQKFPAEDREPNSARTLRAFRAGVADAMRRTCDTTRFQQSGSR